MNLQHEVPEHRPLNPGGSWVERNGFSHWALALIWIVAAFFLFQIAAGIVLVALILLVGGVDPGADVMDMFTRHIDLMFIGNSVGQILFLGFATYLVAGLHISKPEKRSFLKLQTFSNTGQMAGFTALLFVVVQPVIYYLGYLNSLIPVPEVFTDLQQTQYEMIESFLTSDGVLIMGLINIALVPAICEEVMFRGYVQSALEKSWGIWPAIILSGLLFGMFHIQLTNLMPLAALGILLALVTWLSGSLVPAILAHLINNGGAVLLATYYPEMAFTEMSAETAPPVWLLLLSIMFSLFIIKMLYRQSEHR